MKEQHRAKLNREKDKSDPLRYARVKELNRKRYILLINASFSFFFSSLIILGQKETITKNAVVKDLETERAEFNNLLTIVR